MTDQEGMRQQGARQERNSLSELSRVRDMSQPTYVTEQQEWNRVHAQLLKSVADAQAKLLAGLNEISDKLLTRQGERIEQLEVQLAGCMTAAEGWAKDPPKQGDYGWSPAFQDVLDLRRKYEALLAPPRRQVERLRTKRIVKQPRKQRR